MGLINYKYPHLLPPDVPVWERFLNKHGSIYSRIDYDVRVGSGRDPGDRYPENIRQMALLLSQRRIDAVGHAADHIDIIEITANAGLKAIGQLQTYPILYQNTYHPNRPLRPVLVAESIQSDIDDILQKLGVTVYLV